MCTTVHNTWIKYQVMAKKRKQWHARKVTVNTANYFLLSPISTPFLLRDLLLHFCELSNPRIDQSASCPVYELAICELAYPRVVQGYV